jgi:hypothetical protein
MTQTKIEKKNFGIFVFTLIIIFKKQNGFGVLPEKRLSIKHGQMIYTHALSS